MIEVLKSNGYCSNSERVASCFSLRSAAQNRNKLNNGQTSLYKNTVDDDDGPHALHILRTRVSGHIEGYARLVVSDEALTDNFTSVQSAQTPFRRVQPASLMLLQRVSIAATEPHRRELILKELLLAGVETSRAMGMELLGGVACQRAVDEMSRFGLKIMTVGKPIEDTDRWLTRYHFACSYENRAVLRPMALVSGEESSHSVANKPDKLVDELARLNAAHQTRTQVKVGLKLVASN